MNPAERLSELERLAEAGGTRSTAPSVGATHRLRARRPRHCSSWRSSTFVTHRCRDWHDEQIVRATVIAGHAWWAARAPSRRTLTVFGGSLSETNAANRQSHGSGVRMVAIVDC
jgi:hypothetical protein